MNNLVLKADGKGAYYVFVYSNEMATGATKTSYIYLDKTGELKQFETLQALVLK